MIRDLKLLSVDLDKPISDLLAEAIADLVRKHGRTEVTYSTAAPEKNFDGFVKSPILMSFRAKREILRWYYAENRRFLPAVEMTDSLRRTFHESVNFACAQNR